jgi:hypothetical protein
MCRKKKAMFLVSHLAVRTVTARALNGQRITYSLRLILSSQLTSKYFTFTNLKRKENILKTAEKIKRN